MAQRLTWCLSGSRGPCGGTKENLGHLVPFKPRGWSSKATHNRNIPGRLIKTVMSLQPVQEEIM